MPEEKISHPEALLVSFSHSALMFCVRCTSYCLAFLEICQYIREAFFRELD